LVITEISAEIVTPIAVSAEIIASITIAAEIVASIAIAAEIVASITVSAEIVASIAVASIAVASISFAHSQPGLDERFFLAGRRTVVAYRKIYQMTTNYTKLPYIMPNGLKIFQMIIKYNNIFHSKALQNLPKLGVLV
jgi:hypothetical protein